MVGSDRRKQPRFSIAGPLIVKTGVGERIDGEAVDVSLVGFRFYSNDLLNIGEKVSTIVKLPGGTTTPVEGVIRHVTETLPYCYGVAFTEETVGRLIKESF